MFRAFYNSQPVPASWAIDALSLAWEAQGHDPAELLAFLSRAAAGGVDDLDSADAREVLADVIDGLELLPV